MTGIIIVIINLDFYICFENLVSCSHDMILYSIFGGRRDRDRMVVGFTTTCTTKVVNSNPTHGHSTYLCHKCRIIWKLESNHCIV